MELRKSKRREWSWTKFRKKQAEEVKHVVEELEEYWPLTLRQVYYRLVAKGLRENTKAKYQDLSKLIMNMKLSDMLSWNCIEDRSRRTSPKRGYEDAETYIQEEMEILMAQYQRCRVQSQEIYLELWTEKDALSKIFEDVAWPYCIRVVTCRGYDSADFLHKYAVRAKEAQELRGQQPVILYFGDLDPSGWNALEASAQSLEEQHGVDGVIYDRVALTLEQVQKWNLPYDPTAIKKTDSRYKSYFDRFGDVAVELDALHPEHLTRLAEFAIREHFDMDLFEEEMEIEERERARVSDLRSAVREFIAERLGL